MGRPVAADTCRSATVLGGARVVCLRHRGHLGDHQAGSRLRWPARGALAAVVPPRPWIGRPDLHERFLVVVLRGLERADREQAAERAQLRPVRGLSKAEQRQLHSALTDPRRRW